MKRYALLLLWPVGNGSANKVLFSTEITMTKGEAIEFLVDN
jgi:hypothetical protein